MTNRTEEHYGLEARESPIVTPNGVGSMKSSIVDAIRDAIGQGVDEVVVQVSNGASTTNESNVTVNVDTIEVHIHEDNHE